MSLLDRLIDAVRPGETEEERQAARAAARAMATPGDWLSQILDHHQAIERGFTQVRAADDPHLRSAAFEQLRIMLISHASAEEAVIYPAMRAAGERSHAGTAFEEQAKAKVDMAKLEKLSPMSHEFEEELTRVERAVRHHIFKEEHAWLPQLKQRAAPPEQYMASARYGEEFERMSRPS